LSALDASYAYLRQFTPNVLSVIDFQGGPGTADLMAALAVLKELNKSGARKVPAGAPDSFVPTRYAEYLAKARRDEDETAYRHYWELCAVLALRDGLRSGDVYVPGSRRYADPATYLYTPDQWAPKQGDYCRLVGKPASAADALEQGREELHTALEAMEKTLASALPDEVGKVRLDAGDHLVIPKLTAEDIPAEARELKEELASMLPFAPIASLLIELDGRTGFLACFTHAGRKKLTQSAGQRRNILAVLIAMATNLGLARMSEACGISYDVLAWTAEWYVREETLREANTCIVNHHYGLELAKVFGGGIMSSSDGQRFPVRGKSASARDMIVHGGRVLSTYTHVSDQWSTYGTKIIVPTAREAHFALDEFLGNETDLPITEHATDTHGATLINFGLFDLVGKALTPRMRDLTKITLVRDATPTEIAKKYPHAGPLLAARWNEDLVGDCWPDLLRMGGSLKYGQASASLIVGKWSAASRQNIMAAALKARVSESGGGGFAGHDLGDVFPGVILTWAYAGNADGDQFIAQRGSHVGGRGRHLGCVPGAAAAALLDRGGGVAGDGVPDDHQGLDEERERHRTLHGLRRAVAGVASPGELLAGRVRRLDGPPPGVAFRDGLRGRCGVQGEQAQVIGLAGVRVADQDELAGRGLEAAIPQRRAGSDLHCRLLAVGMDDGVAPVRGRSGVLAGADPVALLPRAAPFPGGRGLRPVQHRFRRQPRRPRRAPDDQGLRVEGGVPGAVHLPAGERPRQLFHHLRGQLRLGGGALAAPQPEQHRQRDRRRAQPQPHHQRENHPGVPEGDLLPALGGAVIGPPRLEHALAPPAEEGAVHRHRQRLILAEQVLHSQPRHCQPQLADIPGRGREEPACPPPLAADPRRGGHPGHRAPVGQDQPARQRHEQLPRRAPREHPARRLFQQVPPLRRHG
jgi:TnpA family transposase